MTYSNVAPGDAAPAFTLSDQDGNDVSLAEFRGRRVVLYFYPKDASTGCSIEAREFRDHFARFKRAKVALLGISPDSPRSHKRFHSKESLNFPLLSDTGHEVLVAYGVWQEKLLFGHRYMGAMRTTYVLSPDGIVERVWENVAHEGHAAEVWAFLRGATGSATGAATGGQPTLPRADARRRPRAARKK
ncbi:MAG: thioredoxin-dependent thiol peroxidase [Gemmatimonadaceae bacterium]|nr:thioredoxin-dependent thiol peroxidase [Gemmatimonadaceae bacterium]